MIPPGALGRFAVFAEFAIAMASAEPARANAPALFGFGSDAGARVGAVAASATGFEAAFYNPAGLAFGSTHETALGYLRLGSTLAIRSRHYGITDPDGFLFGATVPVDLGRLGAGWSDRVRLGAAVYFLPNTVVRVITRFPDDPFFPYYENRTQRLVILPALAVRLDERLSVGIAVNFFAGLNGFASAADGPTRAPETTVFQEIHSQLSLNAGLRYRIARGLGLALVYRQQFVVPYVVSTENVVAGNEITIRVAAQGLYTPHEIVLGAAFERAGFLVNLDLEYSVWSAYPGPFVRVETELLGTGTLAPPLPPARYRDTLAVRAGLSAPIHTRPGGEVRVRAGAFFEPSSVPDQTGRTNLIDGDKIGAALGVGVRVTRLGGSFTGALRIEAHATVHHMFDRNHTKVLSPVAAAAGDPGLLVDEDPSTPATIEISNPGFPGIGGGGQAFAAGLTLVLER